MLYVCMCDENVSKIKSESLAGAVSSYIEILWTWSH